MLRDVELCLHHAAFLWFIYWILVCCNQISADFSDKETKFQAFRSNLCGRHVAPDLHQQKHQTDTQQNMTNSTNTGNRGTRTGEKCSSQNLGYAPHYKYHGGQVKANMIGGQYPAGFSSSERKALSLPAPGIEIPVARGHSGSSSDTCR